MKLGIRGTTKSTSAINIALSVSSAIKRPWINHRPSKTIALYDRLAMVNVLCAKLVIIRAKEMSLYTWTGYASDDCDAIASGMRHIRAI